MSPELILESILDELKLWYEKEYRFNPERRWRADYCLTSRNVLIEIEGAVFQNGRHTRGTGFSNDCQKYNSAALLGYKVLRYTTNQIKDDPKQIYEDLKTILEK